MIDNLKDLITHTHDLGSIDLIKITSDTSETVVAGLADDRSIVIEGKFHSPVTEFVGTFGMPNMSVLKTILNISEYAEDADVSVKSDPVKGPVGLNFENKTGDFKNTYRFMAKEIVESMSKPVKFKGANWDIEIEPPVASIQRMKFQAQATPSESTFVAKTEDNNLKFYFGDVSQSAGNFVFASGVTGTLTKNWHWPINHVLNILNLPGDKVFRISDAGAMQIIVDSGLATYSYVLPAQTK